MQNNIKGRKARDLLTIGIDARELSDRPAGKGQYLARLVQVWDNNPKLRLILYTKAGAKLPSEYEKRGTLVVCQDGKGLLWHCAVARRLKRDGVDVFFAALSYQSSIFNPVPTVTVIHDLAIFQHKGYSHNRKAQLVEKLTLKWTCRKSAALVAVSDSTSEDLIAIAKPEANKVRVIKEAALLDRKEQSPIPLGERDPFILFVGTLEPRKNITALISAYAGLSNGLKQSYRLKLAGKTGWGGEDYPALCRKLGVDSLVDFLGYVTNEKMVKLYSKATLFVYPSWYEGFGLPAIEAMSAGTPVITSNTSSFPEVVGDAGILCNPSDSMGLSTAITSLLTDERLWETLSNKAYKRSQIFSWDGVAEEIYNIFEEVS